MAAACRRLWCTFRTPARRILYVVLPRPRKGRFESPTLRRRLKEWRRVGAEGCSVTFRATLCIVKGEHPEEVARIGSRARRAFCKHRAPNDVS